MSEAQARPLLTFAICAYKQEHVIHEAIAGAFAQTYSPLQIILSDDGSSDRTFDLMKQLAGAYSGPHRITLNRNVPNLGIGGHINRLMELAEGELIVIAAGDDISMPGRVSTIYERWDTAGRPIGSLFSDTVEMSEDRTPIGYCTVSPAAAVSVARVLDGEVPPVIGSAHCWHRRLFEVFGPLREGVVNEDSAIFFRSALIGRVLHVHEPLVHHRIHGNNMGAGDRGAAGTPEGLLRFWGKSFARDTALLRNLLGDLDRFQELGYPGEDVPLLMEKSRRALEFSRSAQTFVASGIVRRLIFVLPLIARSPSVTSRRVILTQCLFPACNLRLRAWKEKLRSINRTPAA